MNVKLLEKVKARILRNAGERFNMRYWGDSCKKEKLTDQIGRPPCGTQACLAGETVLAAGLATIDKVNGGIHLKNARCDVKYVAQEALDLTYLQSNKLFMFKQWSSDGNGWPAEFYNAYEQAKTSKARARVAADRIDHFIKTGE